MVHDPEVEVLLVQRSFPGVLGTRKHCVMYSWQSLQFQEGDPNARRELYLNRDAKCARLEPPLVTSMENPPFYAHCSCHASDGTVQDKKTVRLIGISWNLVVYVMSFIDTCLEGCF